jgi:AraC-like DNA-binding protein
LRGGVEGLLDAAGPEIAYLLGFSEPNSFFRSFKRWTGKTPADFRQERSTEAPAPPS